jgi:hypothetical protein
MLLAFLDLITHPLANFVTAERDIGSTKGSTSGAF